MNVPEQAGLEISVVIPVYNGGGTLRACLDSVYSSDYRSFEVIVVDDRSTDDTVAVARSFPCTVIELPENAAPAAARNCGAENSTGRILFFLDADILVSPGTLGLISHALSAQPDVAALFGSYSKHTLASNFFSRYKNLLHHYTHQNSSRNSVNFCGGFGAIRREVFFHLGGFDPRWRFLEDMELGHRLYLGGHQTVLYKELQFTHSKRYSLGSLIRSDLFHRAVPWTRLMMKTRVVRNDLNLKWNNIASVPLSYLLLAALLSLPTGRTFLPAVVGLALLLVLLNARFLSFVRREQGILFAGRCCLMSWFTYLYSGLGFFIGISG